MSFDTTNKGQIWRNDRKETETQPDFKGTINVDGVEYWLSAWKRKHGEHPRAPVLRFSVQSKEELHQQGLNHVKQQLQPQAPPGQHPRSQYQDDLPSQPQYDTGTRSQPQYDPARQLPHQSPSPRPDDFDDDIAF